MIRKTPSIELNGWSGPVHKTRLKSTEDSNNVATAGSFSDEEILRSHTTVTHHDSAHDDEK